MKNNLYDMIENPLNDEDVFFDILGAYGLNKDMYYVFTHNNTEVKKSKDVKDGLTAYYFNKWKNNLLSYSNEDIEKIQNKDKIISLRNLLKNVKDFKNFQEFYDFQNNLLEDKDSEIAKIYMEYFPLYEKDKKASWTHIKSHSLDYKSDEIKDIEHRLYLNVQEEAIDDFSILFMEKCEEKGLPYYFKISNDFQRDDSFVIYSETKYLEKYIEVLKEIKNENLVISKLIKKPPMLTGIIDRFIGYGTDSNINKDGKKTSYNMLRATILPDAIEKELVAWAKEKDILKDKSFIEKIVHCTTEVYLEEEEKKANLYPQLDSSKKYFKLSKDKDYKEKMLDIMKKQVNMRIENGQINYNNLNNTVGIRMACSWLASENIELQTRIKKEISRRLEQLNIDPNNISISKDMIEVLKQIKIGNKNSNIDSRKSEMVENISDSSTYADSDSFNDDNTDLLREIFGDSFDDGNEEFSEEAIFDDLDKKLGEEEQEFDELSESQVFEDLDKMLGTEEETNEKSNEEEQMEKLSKKQVFEDLDKVLETQEETNEKPSKEEQNEKLSKTQVFEDLETKLTEKENKRNKKLSDDIFNELMSRIKTPSKKANKISINEQNIKANNIENAKLKKNECYSLMVIDQPKKKRNPVPKARKKDFRPTGYKAMDNVDILISQYKIGNYKPTPVKK